jgi:hypothetical protein
MVKKKRIYEVNELMTASAFSKYIAKQSGRYKGVLTLAEAPDEGSITFISSRDRKCVFISDDHTFGFSVLPRDFCAMSTHVHMDGLHSAKEILNKIYPSMHHIQSVQELVNILNS